MYEGEEQHTETHEDQFNICVADTVVRRDKSTEIGLLKEDLPLEEAGQVVKEESEVLQLNKMKKQISSKKM